MKLTYNQSCFHFSPSIQPKPPATGFFLNFGLRPLGSGGDPKFKKKPSAVVLVEFRGVEKKRVKTFGGGAFGAANALRLLACGPLLPA